MLKPLYKTFDQQETARRLNQFGKWWDELDAVGFDWEGKEIETEEEKYEIWRIWKELFEGDYPDSPDNYDPIN